MERMTARNIALISPMRPGFAALVKASSFAADIIAKYSGTEMFPFSGDALVYFNALNHQLAEEKKLRDSINYTLHLLVLRRLILEGKAADPTVTKQFLTSVNGNIEQNLHYLRISDNNAYIRAVEAQSYINNSEEFTRNILSSEVYEGAQYYRYSTVDISPLVQRFFGENSESYAYSGTYFYNEPPAFVYKKEIIESEGSSVPAEGTPASEQRETAAAAPGSESTEYSYNTENLTYKTENSVNNESTDIHSAENVQNVRNTQDIRNIQNTTDITRTAQDNRSLSENAVTAAGSASVQGNADVRNIPDIRETRTDGDIRFIQNVQQTSGSSSGGALSGVSADNTEISSESIINAGDTAYNYDSRNFTYRTENYAPEENTGITNVQNTQNVHNSDENIQNNENSIYSSVTDIHAENTGAASETVVNIDGTSYNYDTGNLVYKAENTVNSENSDIRNVQNTQDIRNTVQNVPADRQSQSSGNVQNTPELSDNVVFPQTANIGGTEVIGIRNAGSELYVRNITDVREISEKLSGQAVQDIRNRQEYGDGQESDAPEAAGSAPVTGTAADSADIIPESVVNVGAASYNYDTENLTYKTENTVNNSDTDIGGSENIRNEQNVLNVTDNTQNVRNITGSSFSESVTNISVTGASDVHTDILNEPDIPEVHDTVEERNVSGISQTLPDNGASAVSALMPGITAENDGLASESILNVGDTNYNYDTENLTYKTENAVNNENTGILNIQRNEELRDTQNIRNISEMQEIRNISQLTENTVPTSAADSAEAEKQTAPETVVNAGVTSYNYDTENLTYKTENAVNNENTDILNTRSVTDAGLSVQNIQQTQNNENVLNLSENIVSAPVTNVSAGDTELISGTVLNVGGTSYNYDTENLTYKTETNVNSGGTDIRNITENTVSAPVTNVSADNTRISSENVVNAGDTSFSYDTQNIIYKAGTEIPGTREKTGYEEPAEIRGAENARAAAESAAEAAEAALRKVSDIASVDLLVMNTFLSRGAEYFSNVRNRAAHRHITLTPAAMPARGNAAIGLLNSPVSSLGVLSYAIRLLVSENEPNARERSIYDSAVTQIYAERHTRPDIGTKEMLAALSVPERTKVLRLVTEKLAGITAADIDTQPVRNERPASASVESASVPVKERMRDLPAAERHTVSESRAYGAAGISGRITENGTDNSKNAPVQPAADVQSGISGTDGQNGASGAAGMTGPAGVNGTAGASGTDGMSGTEGAAGTNGLNGSNGINAEPRSITETELKLLRLLTGDMNGETLRRAGTSAAAGTAASLLYKLYYGLPAASGEDRVLPVTANTDNIVYMPALMNYLTVPDHGMNSVPQALTSHITVGNAGNLTTAQSGEEIARYMSYPQTTFHNTSEVSDYRTDLRNINSIQTQQNTFISQVHQPAVPGTPAQTVSGTAPAAVPGMISGAPAQGIAGASSPKGITGPAAVYQEIPGGTNGTQTVFRKEHTTHDIVRNVLDRINRYERSMKTAAEHTAASERSRTAPAVPAARNTGSVPGVRAAVTGTSPAAMHGISAAAPGTASTVSPGATTVQSPVYATDIAYDDTYLNYTFNTAVSEYELPVTMTPQNAVSESVRLLPVYTLDGMILPGNRGDITAGRSSGLPRASVHNGRSVMTHRHIMTVLNGRSLTARNGSPGVPGRDGANAAADSTPQSMLPLMPESAPLSYREPVPQATSAPPVPQAAEPAPPSAAELVKQFGNLVEGGDAGLTPSFEIGTHGFGEAMAAIEQTAEKVAANSKMIEEIREKQRAIESVTLKSSDIDAISEEMIRKLRSRMRLDRSRFSGL